MKRVKTIFVLIMIAVLVSLGSLGCKDKDEQSTDQITTEEEHPTEHPSSEQPADEDTTEEEQPSEQPADENTPADENAPAEEHPTEHPSSEHPN